MSKKKYDKPKQVKNHKNRFKEAIDDWMEQQGIEAKWLHEYLGVSKRYFRSAKNNFPTNREKQKPFSLDFVRSMVMGTGIDPNTFLLNPAELKNWRQKKKGNVEKKLFLEGKDIYSPWGPIPRASHEIINLQDFKPGNSQDRIEGIAKLYTDKVISSIENSTQSISIVEYLGKGSLRNPGHHLKHYQEAHKDIFRAIEEKLALNDHPNLKYTRILALPREEFFKTPGPHNYQEKDQHEIRFEAIKLISSVSFKHIYHCLQKFDRDKVKFCIALASRPVHFGIYANKDSQCILTEYYRYGENVSILLPDILFIEMFENEGKSPLVQLCRRYENEIEKDLDTGLHLTRDNIDKDIKAVNDKIEKEDILSRYNQKMKEIMDEKINFAKNYSIDN